MLQKHGLLLSFISVFLVSCTVGPDYVRPSVVVPIQFKEAKAKTPEWKLAEPCDDVRRGEWWTIFHDATLNKLEHELNHHNQNIAVALANYCQARELVDEARASYFPTVSGVLSVFRQKGGGSTQFISDSSTTGTSTGVATTGSVSANPRTVTSFSGFLNANWEPDVWGLVRRTVEGDVAAAQASQALAAVTRLSAQGALAQIYYELRAVDMDQKLLNLTVSDYKKALQLTKNQYRSGVASRADIVSAQSQLEIAEAAALNNGILRSQYEHAIAVLIGRNPSDLNLVFNPLNIKPPVIPLVIPSSLLERRPDIAQAERLMQQANAQIGVAVAAYYPALNLSGSLSVGATSLARLIRKPNIGWSYGMQMAEILFDGGLRSATVKAAQAGYMAQVASYRQTVLTAFQDVEDNLVALRILEQESLVLNQAARSANRALQLTINQYKAGTVPYSSVITAQITAYTAQKNAYDAVGLQMTAAVGLIKALGGGWRVEDLNPV